MLVVHTIHVCISHSLLANSENCSVYIVVTAVLNVDAALVTDLHVTGCQLFSV